MSALETLRPKGNAVVPSDAPILPAQVFVDYWYNITANNLGLSTLNFSLPNKAVTKCADFIDDFLISNYIGVLPGIDVSGGTLPQSEVDAILALTALGTAGLTSTDADKIIDVSGGTSADPTGGPEAIQLWGNHGADIVININVNGKPASFDPYGVIAYTCDLRGTNMTSAQVNSLLAFLVDEHATDYFPTLRLDGAGMGAPTGTGLTDKASLIDAGWTVTTN